MPDLRQAVLDELARRGWSHYQLVQALKGKRPGGRDVPPVTVYEFLRGETAINSNDLGLIFEALELEPKRRLPARAPRRRLGPQNARQRSG